MPKKSSSRRTIDYSKRKVKNRRWFLIVCEGEKTEPNYFRSFAVDTKVIKLDIKGEGKNTRSLVEKAIELKNDSEYDESDRFWCVFDRDINGKNSNDAQNFNAAMTLAKNNGIKVAYSNDAFELWYLLHFHFYNTGISRKDYQNMLTKLLGYEYQQNSETIYEELKNKQQDAIKHAKRLLMEYDRPNPESDNPSTTVHLLVEELNSFIPKS
ncbi:MULTISPECIES: RloB family protein [unclassified Microcoleus]|uniref:RloB family protein n=1 Tax=unclassified Microcoleus TaxID=2642155 RepID=UPI001DAE9C94|nr:MULTISPECIES: RloB family protein [unclassified Microcoleus]MCC3598682.1 RloB domain-containing protein [Microcoleus sp. PH2017_26_ELK_O_A]MCC3623704.1 RloB domain-containing protein [Microcoleus sp. PH2017_36_ELK_O_B]